MTGDVDGPQAWRKLSPTERSKWAELVVPHIVVDRDAHVIAATCVCPTCHHGFTVALLDGDLYSFQLRGPNWQTTLRFTLPCCCEGEHPGRPQELSLGCGASARFTDSV